MIEATQLDTPPVRLSMLTEADAAAHLAGDDGELARWFSGGPSTAATVAAYLQRCRDQWEAGGPVHAFGIRVGQPSALAGTIEVQWERPYLDAGQVNLAYGVYPGWRGQGVARRAVELACEHAQANGASEAIIRVHPGNHASVTVARRSGFTYLHTSDSDETPLQWWARPLNPPLPLPGHMLEVVGLVLLIGPPGAGKSTFARSLVQAGAADRNAIVSADQIASIMFGGIEESDIRDPLVFAEVDRRVHARLGKGLPVVVDATNVRPEARTRLIRLADQYGQVVAAWRFTAEPGIVLAQNAARAKRLPEETVLAYIKAMNDQTSTETLRAEGILLIHDVPGVRQAEH